YWRIGSLKPACAPTRRMSRLTTVASTGRLIKILVKCIGLLPRPLGLWLQRVAIVDLDRRTGLELELAARHHLVAFVDSFDNGNSLALRLPEAHEAPLRDQLLFRGAARRHGLARA